MSQKYLGRTSVKAKTIDGADARHKRHELTVQLRAQKREEAINKRRTKMVEDIESESFPPMPIMLADVQVYLERIRDLIVNTSVPPHRLAEALTALRRFVSIRTKDMQQRLGGLHADLVPRVLQILDATLATQQQQQQEENNMISIAQLDAVWYLTNLASGTSAETNIIAHAPGALELIRRLMYAPTTSPELRDQCVWLIGNIAGDSAELRDLVLAHGMLEAIVELCRQSYSNNCSWALSNLVLHQPPPALDDAQFDIILQACAQVLDTEGVNADVVSSICWTITRVADVGTRLVNRIISLGLPQRLVPLLMYPQRSYEYKSAILRTIGTIAADEDERGTQSLLDSRILPALLALMVSPHESLRKESSWVVSNICGGSEAQIDAVMHMQLVPPMLHLLKGEELFSVQTQVIYALTNIARDGSDAHANELIRLKAAEHLCHFLGIGGVDVTVAILEAFQRLLLLGQNNRTLDERGDLLPNLVVIQLRSAGAIETIANQLRFHENVNIRRTTQTLLDQYLEEEEDGTEDYPNDEDTTDMLDAAVATGIAAPYHTQRHFQFD